MIILLIEKPLSPAPPRVPKAATGATPRYRKSKVDAWIEQQTHTPEKKPKGKEE